MYVLNKCLKISKPMDIYRSTHVELLLTQHKAQTTLHTLQDHALKVPDNKFLLIGLKAIPTQSADFSIYNL